MQTAALGGSAQRFGMWRCNLQGYSLPSTAVRSWWRGVKKDRYESNPTVMAAMETLPKSI